MHLAPLKMSDTGKDCTEILFYSLSQMRKAFLVAFLKGKATIETLVKYRFVVFWCFRCKHK